LLEKGFNTVALKIFTSVKSATFSTLSSVERKGGSQHNLQALLHSLFLCAVTSYSLSWGGATCCWFPTLPCCW
jgi:hypothetical protein